MPAKLANQKLENRTGIALHKSEQGGIALASNPSAEKFADYPAPAQRQIIQNLRQSGASKKNRQPNDFKGLKNIISHL